MKEATKFLGPVDELPPEGADFSPDTSSEVDFCASLFSDSTITFDVSRDGVFVHSNPQDAELFQELELLSDEDGEQVDIQWNENALEIQLQKLFPGASAFQTLSDASEPEDYVRRFLEVMASSLNHELIEHEGPKVPLIRWEAGDGGESARIQLLGLLLADKEHFEKFCNNDLGELGLIFEDPEIQAHGLRETVTALVVLGISLGSAQNVEAGLFKKLRQKRQAARAQQVVQQQYIQRANAAIQQQQQRAAQQQANHQQQRGWQDVHNDAYINYNLLESNKDGERTVIVDVEAQRAYLIVDGAVAISTAVSTARSGKVTPRGVFKITERVESGKTSTIYGCSLPYWQRLDQSAIGLHIGDLPGYPASAGCIRLPHSVAPILFANTASGVEVKVVDSWDQQGHQHQQQGEYFAQVSHQARR